MRKTNIVTWVCGLGSLGLAMARAQTATGEAEQLFRDGKRLMGEGNIAEACTAFEGSYRKDPAVSTLLNLADCREKNHQYASAWGHFIDAARTTRSNPDQANLNKTAQDRAAALESRLSYLIINVPRESQVEGLTITRSGVAVDEAEWNRDIPVDGGEYRIEARAPGYEAWSTTVKVTDAKDKESVNVPKFHQLPAGSRTTPHDRAQGPSGRQKVAIGAWVGAGGLVAASIAFELSGEGTYEDAKAATTNQRRTELYDSSNRQRTVAVVAGATALAAVGVGTFLWVTGKHERRGAALSAAASDRGVSLLVHGEF